MKAAQLLEHFYRLSEAPGAVPRLRRFILDLAVRGKLVAQEAGDEPAGELLKWIQTEKTRLVDAGVLKPEKPPQLRTEIQTLAPLPCGWKFVHLQDVCVSITDGDHLPPPQTENGVPFLVIGNVRSQTIDFAGCRYVADSYYQELAEIRRPTDGDILYTLVGSYGIPVIVKDTRPFCVQRHIGILRPSKNVSLAFLAHLLKSGLAFDQATKCATGIAQKTVPLTGLRAMRIPLPPLAEQHRIATKVDELMVLCDQLEAAQQERERRRDRLAAASLQRLNQPAATNPATQREHARFHLHHLSRLTTRPGDIKAMRAAIRALAVRGKLVAQEAGNEPTAESIPLFDFDGSLHSIPQSWVWASLGQLADMVTDGEHLTPPRIAERQIPLVTAKNVRDGEMDYGATDWVSNETAEKAWRRCRPTVGDILMVCVGATTGRLCILRKHHDMVLVRSVAVIRPSRRVCADFLALAIRSPVGQRQIWSSVKVTAQPCLYINRINSLAIPLPPLAEQHRIVAKVDSLMALCDQLEAQLTTTQTDSRRLLEAVLEAALAPT